MTKPRAKHNAREVVKIANSIYLLKDHDVGGCCHIVLGDCNIDDDSIEFCLREARSRQCSPCEHLMILMMEMSMTQRNKVVNSHRFGSPLPVKAGP